MKHDQTMILKALAITMQDNGWNYSHSENGCYIFWSGTVGDLNIIKFSDLESLADFVLKL